MRNLILIFFQIILRGIGNDKPLPYLDKESLSIWHGNLRMFELAKRRRRTLGSTRRTWGVGAPSR